MKDNIKIGLALSGGGIRAAITHLGLLKWLAEMELMELVEHISSVSGASLCVGLIYSCNNYKWPGSKEFLERVLPRVEETILSTDIQKSAIFRLIVTPWNINKKANVLAKTIGQVWGIKGTFANISEKPKWSINTTTYETGKNFRFSQTKMGDYKIGYSTTEKFKLIDAMAASASFPVLIGLFRMKMKKYKWMDAQGREIIDQSFKKIHLWDGGVYDNLGLEALYKIENDGMLTGNINFLIVSNASASTINKKELGGRPRRLLDIAMNQVGILRSRDVLSFINKTKQGMYIKIDHTCEDILRLSNASEATKKEIAQFTCLSEECVHKLKSYPTTLLTPTKEYFDFLLLHGYENSKCVYTCYDNILKTQIAK